MPPKRGRGTKRSAKGDSKNATATKIKREDSDNTKLRNAIAEIKSSDTKKVKKYKPDQTFASQIGDIKIHEDYACMLNQTNIGHNNNKFYVIQVGAFKNGFACFTKWGRVGETGMNSCDTYNSADDAIKHFEKKFKDKTKNNWSERDNFQPKTGKYTLIEMDEDSDEEDVADGQASMTISKTIGNSSVKCTLDSRTQLFLRLIFNDDMFVNQMSAMNLNVNKMPLGKLSKNQIAKGLEVLLELEDAIKTKKGNYNDLTSRFYTVIPHDFGRSVPAVINTMDVVNSKKEMMMTLSDIELTQSMQKETTDSDLMHPLDAKYKMLNATLELINRKSEEFKLLEKYSKACPNTRKGPLLDAWKVDRDCEGDRFAQHDDIKYRKLLWHGTNVAVVAAILKAGLRIMPHSGGLVGRGIYFASEHAKSSWYVRPHNGFFETEENVGFMFLVEVALGNMNFITRSNGSLTKAPPGYQSIVARGRCEPDPKKNVIKKFDGHDVEIPVGTPVPQNDFQQSGFFQSEYLVYKESQARIRYILKYSFDR